MSQTEEASASGGGSEESSTQEGTFECNICLDTAKDAVVSLCGHLFCWPCLHRWLETRPNRQVCPVCKAVISREKVIPLYGRGASKQDPREKLPPRPPGQRTEPENSTGQTFPAFGFGDGGFHMSFGIGAFPFGIFTSSFNFGDGRPAPDRNIGGIHNIGGNVFIADNSDNSSEEDMDYISDDFEERENDRDEEENSYSDNSSDEDLAYIDDDVDETSEDSIDNLDEDEMSEDSIDDLDEDETSEDSIDDLDEIREAEEAGGNNFIEYSPCISSDEDSDYHLEQ